MSSSWLLTRFDYARYVEIRPAMRQASTADVFAELANSPETQAIAASVEDGSVSARDARAAFVVSVCSLGEPLTFESGLPCLVAAVSRRPGGEIAAETLEALIAGEINMEPWLLGSSGLAGFLKPEQVRALQAEFHRVAPATYRGLKAMHGTTGIVAAMGRFVARLLDRSPGWREMLLPLGALIDEAANRGEAIAAVEY